MPVFRVGGSLPVIFAYYTEFQPKEKRGSMISLLATFWMCGNIVAAGNIDLLHSLVLPQQIFTSFSNAASFILNVSLILLNFYHNFYCYD